MKKSYEVSWTNEANEKVALIYEYLIINWNEAVADNFLDLLFKFERNISFFPKSFKSSRKFKNCRLGLVHPHVSVIYKVKKNSIVILTVFDNRSNQER
jgi:plasmid stabilization system protein ParE